MRLVIMLGGVAGATLLGLYHAQGNPEQWATVLILGVTAGIAAWYANATHQLVVATRKNTRAALRCTFVVASPVGLRGGSISVKNTGPLVARAVKVYSGPKAEGTLRCEETYVNAGEGCRVEDVATDDDYVTVTWLNAIGAPEEEHFRWVYPGWTVVSA